MNLHISTIHNRIGQNGNINFYVSMLKEAKKVIPNNKKLSVLDFGCGHGDFLQLADLLIDIEYGLGIDFNADRIEYAKNKNTLDFIEYFYGDEKCLTALKHKFDVAFSQEVIYTIRDLQSHAASIFNSLKNGGFYFATMGCNTDNPFWKKRRELIKSEEQYPVNNYSLSFVCKTFKKVGFEVCLKSLPLEFFCVYDDKIAESFGGVASLLQHCENYKILFCFYKA